MADIKVRIEINPEAESQNIQKLSSWDDLANTSIQTIRTEVSSYFEHIPTKEDYEGGSKGLAFAPTDDLVFDDDDMLVVEDETGNYIEDEQNSNELIFGVVPANKELQVDIGIEATNLKKVVIYGDKQANQFPTEAIIYKREGMLHTPVIITSDDPVWAINLENADPHIIFTKWNRSNYNACISLISIMLQYLDFDKNTGLKSVDSLTQSIAQPDEISYGVIANSGSTQLLDIDGELEDNVKDNVLSNSNIPIQVYANGSLVQTHVSSNSNYTSGARILELELTNDISSLDKLKYGGYPYPNTSKTAYEVLFDVMYNLKNTTEVPFTTTLFDAMFSSSIKTLLQGISITYPYIEGNLTYREVLEMFCNLAQLQVFLDNENNFKFVNARPVFNTSEQTPIKIESKDMFTPLSYDLMLKNQYQGVEINSTKVNDVTDINAVLVTQKTGFVGNNDRNENSGTSSSYYNYAEVWGRWFSGTITVPKTSPDNLNQVTSISTDTNTAGEPYTKYIVNYTHQTGGASFLQIAGQQNPTIIPDYTSTDTGSGSLATYSTISTTSPYGNITASINDQSNLKHVSVTEDADNFYVFVKFLISYTKLNASFNTITQSIASGFSEYYSADSVEISIYGAKRTISFEQQSESTDGIGSIQTFASVPDSILRQSDGSQTTNIKANILSDYANGIHTANVKVQCGDYYDGSSNLVKNWANGQIFNVGDIVYFDTQRYWKVVGRRFTKTGVPMQELQLQECYPLA